MDEEGVEELFQIFVEVFQECVQGDQAANGAD